MSGLRPLLRWHADPLVLLGLAALALAYLLGVRRVEARGGTVSRGRVRAWAAAVGVLALALCSPLATYSEERFSVHMVQHLLLTYAAAPLLALGAPVTLALQATRADLRRSVLLPALHSRVARVLSFPVLTWVAFAGVMYATHFSPIYDASLGNPLIHGIEHLLYLSAAVLFWWPVVRADPVPGSFPWPARLLYLLLALPFQSVLGVAILDSDRVLYSRYAGVDALDDQQLAGAIMWVGGDVLMLIAIGIGIAAWMRYEDRATARLDARLDAARRAS